MSEEPTGLLEPACEYQRILGIHEGAEPGPLILVMAGMHGNEPAGIRAVGQLLSRLRAENPPMRGRLIALAGNLTALRAQTRFVDKDFNRVWIREWTARLEREGSGEAEEDRQQLELLGTLRELFSEGPTSVYFLDLHTSSAEGPPFVTIGDTLRNRRFAMGLPLPVILGLEEQVDGALLEYLNNLGVVTMGVEAGRHDRLESVDRHLAVLWFTLIKAGALRPEHVPELTGHRRLLADASRGVPRVVEVRHRHPIRQGDGFRMDPGFANFQSIDKGQRLAEDEHGPIFAREGGLVLLPLYQGQGDDGFFIAREVREFWLSVSAVLRRLRVGLLMRMLPGVRAHGRRRDTLRVNTRVARLFPLEIFHLLGFRKLRRDGDELLVSRRAFDLTAPQRISFESVDSPDVAGMQD